jgi:hypothetical protein
VSCVLWRYHAQHRMIIMISSYQWYIPPIIIPHCISCINPNQTNRWVILIIAVGGALVLCITALIIVKCCCSSESTKTTSSKIAGEFSPVRASHHSFTSSCLYFFLALSLLPIVLPSLIASPEPHITACHIHRHFLVQVPPPPTAQHPIHLAICV